MEESFAQIVVNGISLLTVGQMNGLPATTAERDIIRLRLPNIMQVKTIFVQGNMQFQAKQTTAEEFKERGRKSAEMKNMKDNDKIKKIKMMQAAVLERMMTPEEYEGLVNRYMENRGNSGMHQREKFLKKPLSPSEKDTLAQYFEFAPARKLAETLGARVSRDIIARIALRWIFQNKESLHLEELLKEGENK